MNATWIYMNGLAGYTLLDRKIVWKMSIFQGGHVKTSTKAYHTGEKNLGLHLKFQYFSTQNLTKILEEFCPNFTSLHIIEIILTIA